MKNFKPAIFMAAALIMLAACSPNVCYKSREGKAKMKYFNGIQYGHHLKGKGNRN